MLRIICLYKCNISSLSKDGQVDSTSIDGVVPYYTICALCSLHIHAHRYNYSHHDHLHHRLPDFNVILLHLL